MKPKSLAPGDKIVLDGHEMTFIRRDRAMHRNWFNCPDYAGLNGSNDKGDCWVSDYRHRFAKRLNPPEAGVEK